MISGQDGPTTKQRRARRPTEAAARLERLRQRNAEQLEAQREAERRVETALKAYVDADVSINAVERDRDEKVAGLNQQIEQARAATQMKIEQIRRQQADAVWQLSDTGRTVEQIAELLELPQKEARRLLAAGRKAANSDAPDQGRQDDEPDGAAGPAGRQPQRSREQSGLRGVDGDQDGSDRGLVPSVPDGGGQRA